MALGTCVDIFAPGNNIISASLNGGSTLKSGTSMASPHVAGAVALYLENNTSASPTAVKSALLSASSNVTIGNAGSGSPNKLLNISAISPVITVPTEDDYDNVSIRGFTDDYEGDAVPLFKNAPQIHNFHDSSDEDWTMVWIGKNSVYQFKTDKIGSNSNTNFEVYKVTEIVLNPNYPNQNRFIIHDMQLVATGTNNSPKIIEADGGFLYVMKVVSSNNSIGSNTEYRVSLNKLSIANDQYDNVSIRGFTDDYEGDAEPLFGNNPQIHNFHDSGDKDWTMVWVSNPATFNVEVNMIGHVSDAKLSVYKVTDVIVNPSYPGMNRFIINDKELVASDVSSGNKNLTINADGGFLYVMKVESRINTSGYGTEYEINLY